MRRLKPTPVDDKGWTDWIQPKKRGFVLACCDCGLSHRLQFRIVHKGKRQGIQFRAKRDRKQTTIQRKRLRLVNQRVLGWSSHDRRISK